MSASDPKADLRLDERQHGSRRDNNAYSADRGIFLAAWEYALMAWRYCANWSSNPSPEVASDQ